MATTSSTSSSTGTSVIQSLGLGSGLDIGTLTDELTTAEMSAANNRIKREQSDVTTQVSALASLKSALSTLQSSIDSLTDSTAFNTRSVSSSDEDVFTATAASNAAVGSYDVTVKQLAKAQQLVSNVFTNGASGVVGTGTLTIGSGSTSADIVIDSSNNTLLGIRNAINKVAGSTGVSATLVYGTTGAQLLLSGTRTGASNTITVNTSGGDGGLQTLVYNTTTTNNYTVKQTPQDSIVSIAGVDHKSSSNVVSDAIDGVTLTLKKEQPDTAVSLTLGNDSDHVNSMLQSLVTAYNTYVRTTQSLSSYDSSTKTAGPMLGDALLTGMQSQISRILASQVTSVNTKYSTLSNVGISLNQDGTLSLDSSKLSAALSDNYAAVTSALSAKDGAISKLSSFLESALASGSSIDARNTSLTNQQKSIDQEQQAVDARTAVVKQRYLDKFNTMDSLLSKLNSTSSYLTQTFDALNKSDK